MSPPPLGPLDALVVLSLLVALPGLLLGLLGGRAEALSLSGLLLLSALGMGAAAAWSLLRARAHQEWAALGLRRPDPSWRRSTPLLALAMIPLALGYEALVQALGLEGAQRIAQALRAATGAARGLGILYALLLAPLLEELVFRGLLQEVLGRRLGARAGLALTALVFALLHLDHPPVLPYLLLLGLLLGGSRALTGSLLPPVLLHMANNALAVLGLLLGSAEG